MIKCDATYDSLYFFDYHSLEVCDDNAYQIIKKQHTMTVVMSATPEYAFAIANVLIGLERHSPGFADRVIIYHTGISDHDKQVLNKIRQCDFIDYAPSKFMNIKQTHKIKAYSLASFAIFEMFNLLNTSKFALYLDTDILIHRDIRQIISFGPMAMRLCGKPLSIALGATPPPGIDGSQSTGNSGVVLMSDKIPFCNATESCYQQALNYWETLHLPDQAILTLVCNLHNIQINHLPAIYNQKIDIFRPDRIITHQLGKKKFWNNGLVNTLAPEWQLNNALWIELGGTPFAGKIEFEKIMTTQNKFVEKFSMCITNFNNAIKIFLKKIQCHILNKYNLQSRLDSNSDILYIDIFGSKGSTYIISFKRMYSIQISIYISDIKQINHFDKKDLDLLKYRFVFFAKKQTAQIIHILSITDKIILDDTMVNSCCDILHELIITTAPFFPACFDTNNRARVYEAITPIDRPLA